MRGVGSIRTKGNDIVQGEGHIRDQDQDHCRCRRGGIGIEMMTAVDGSGVLPLIGIAIAGIREEGSISRSDIYA